MLSDDPNRLPLQADVLDLVSAQDESNETIVAGTGDQASFHYLLGYLWPSKPKALLNHTATPSQSPLDHTHIDFEQDLVQLIKTPNEPSAFQD